MNDWITFYCLETGTNLVPADPQLLNEINAQIKAKRVVDRLGRPIEVTWDGALVNAPRTIAYRVVHGVPQLVREEAISLAELRTTINESQGI